MLMGMLIWMYSINIYSISGTYFSGRIYAETRDIYNFMPRKDIMIHAVKNMVVQQGKSNSRKKKKNIQPEEEETIVAEAAQTDTQTMLSMYDVAITFQDCTYPENTGSNICDLYGNEYTTGGVLIKRSTKEHAITAHYFPNPPYQGLEPMIETQVKAGMLAMQSITKLPASRINATVFNEKAKNLANEFHHFDYTDCQLNEQSRGDVREVDKKHTFYLPASNDRSMSLMELLGLYNRTNYSH